MATTPPRMVLDTNACLDLFVFAEPDVASLHDALQHGEAVAVTNTACRDEWLRVLRYPMLKLDEDKIAAAIAAHDALVACLVDTPVPTESGRHTCPAGAVERGDGGPALPDANTGVPLPRCADPDDQKFLQLAHACGARWLLSRDKALLALARRAQRDGLFRILPPAAWHADA